MSIVLIGQKQKVAAEVEIDRNGNLSVLVRLHPRLPNSPTNLTTSQKVAILVADRIKRAVTGLMREAESGAFRAMRAGGELHPSPVVTRQLRDDVPKRAGRGDGGVGGRPEHADVEDPRGDVPAAVSESRDEGETERAVDGDDSEGDGDGDC